MRWPAIQGQIGRFWSIRHQNNAKTSRHRGTRMGLFIPLCWIAISSISGTLVQRKCSQRRSMTTLRTTNPPADEITGCPAQRLLSPNLSLQGSRAIELFAIRGRRRSGSPTCGWWEQTSSHTAWAQRPPQLCKSPKKSANPNFSWRRGEKWGTIGNEFPRVSPNLSGQHITPDGNGAPKPANPTGTRLKWGGFGKKLDPLGLMGRVRGWQTRTRKPALSPNPIPNNHMPK
jgi:hypothetical protein